VIQYTASSMTYTLSVALPHLLRYPVSDVSMAVMVIKNKKPFTTNCL
jgi:hypothetical protein